MKKILSVFQIIVNKIAIILVTTDNIMLFIMSIIFPPVIFFSKLFIYLINNLYNMNNVKAFFLR